MAKDTTKKKFFIENLKRSFLITFTYVSGATIYCFLVSYSPNVSAVLDGILYLILLPAVVFPTLILYADSHAMTEVLICQTLTFFVFWIMIFKIVERFRRHKIKNDNKPVD